MTASSLNTGAATVYSRRAFTVTQRVCGVMGATAMATGLFQLIALGADPWVSILAVGTVFAALLPIWVYGVGRSIGVFFLFVCCYWGLNALVVKSVLLQPLDSYLYTPVLSHLIVFIAISGSSLGAVLARPLMQVVPQIRWPAATPSFLRSVSQASLVIGILGLVLSRLGGGAQALSIFLSSYFILAFSAECARELLLTQGRRHISVFGVVIAALLMLVSLASNSKFGIMAIPLAYVVTVFAFGGRFRVSHAVLGVVAAIFLSSVVFPAITFIARSDRNQVSATQLVSNTFVAMQNLATGDEAVRVQLEAREARNARAGGWRYDVPYQRHVPLIFERFLLVPFVDAVARRLSVSGPFAGTSFITSQLANTLPAFINPNKVEAYSGNEIVVSLRLADSGFAGFPTMGWPAEAFYAGNLSFVFLSSIAVFFLFSLALSVTIGRTAGNIFAVFIVTRYFHLLTCGVFSNFAYFTIRQLPVDLLLFGVMILIARWRGLGVTPSAYGPGR
ncbi:MAG: hypothetical protein KKA16_14545 [Alphaproteobacteria bacterium]|nr:hypothetical protein [Alphaproteobacteria bacterium]MBU2378749.1 hypothetical protein [Alphaproteobacteria bacterium]